MQPLNNLEASYIKDLLLTKNVVTSAAQYVAKHTSDFQILATVATVVSEPFNHLKCSMGINLMKQTPTIFKIEDEFFPQKAKKPYITEVFNIDDVKLEQILDEDTLELHRKAKNPEVEIFTISKSVYSTIMRINELLKNGDELNMPQSKSRSCACMIL